MLKVYAFHQEEVRDKAFIEHYEKNRAVGPQPGARSPCTSATTWCGVTIQSGRRHDRLRRHHRLVFLTGRFIEWVEKLGVEAIATDERFLVGRGPGPTSSRARVLMALRQRLLLRR
jgi:hypothetical protein